MVSGDAAGRALSEAYGAQAVTLLREHGALVWASPGGGHLSQVTPPTAFLPWVTVHRLRNRCFLLAFPCPAFPQGPVLDAQLPQCLSRPRCEACVGVLRAVLCMTGLSSHSGFQQ